MVESQINPYESSTSPQAEGLRRNGFSGWYFVTMLWGILLFISLLVLRPGFIDIYEDFEVELPLLTRFAIHWSLPAIVLVVTLLFAVKEFLPFPAEWKRKLNLAGALVLICVGLVLAYALFIPLVVTIGEMN